MLLMDVEMAHHWDHPLDLMYCMLADSEDNP
jgi:hypothetical protein